MSKEVENKEVERLKKVKFLLSSSGVFLLPYSPGELVELSISLANKLIEAKFAQAVD